MPRVWLDRTFSRSFFFTDEGLEIAYEQVQLILLLHGQLGFHRFGHDDVGPFDLFSGAGQAELQRLDHQGRKRLLEAKENLSLMPLQQLEPRGVVGFHGQEASREVRDSAMGSRMAFVQSRNGREDFIPTIDNRHQFSDGPAASRFQKVFKVALAPVQFHEQQPTLYSVQRPHAGEGGQTRLPG